MKKQYFFNVLKSLFCTTIIAVQAFTVTAQEEVIDFSGLSAGTLLAEQYSAQGIHIWSEADDGHPDLLMVFNSDASGTADPDLEVGIGNIAIFPYNSTDVDDTPDGGKMYFDFDEDVTVCLQTKVDWGQSKLSHSFNT